MHFSCTHFISKCHVHLTAACDTAPASVRGTWRSDIAVMEHVTPEAKTFLWSYVIAQEDVISTHNRKHHGKYNEFVLSILIIS